MAVYANMVPAVARGSHPYTARVEYANIIVANGVVHVIDAVLIPKVF